jgi:hypothetical protein
VLVLLTIWRLKEKGIAFVELFFLQLDSKTHEMSKASLFCFSYNNIFMNMDFESLKYDQEMWLRQKAV